MLSFAIAVPPSELSDLIGTSAIPSLQNGASATLRPAIGGECTKKDRWQFFGAEVGSVARARWLVWPEQLIVEMAFASGLNVDLGESRQWRECAISSFEMVDSDKS